MLQCVDCLLSIQTAWSELTVASYNNIFEDNLSAYKMDFRDRPKCSPEECKVGSMNCCMCYFALKENKMIINSKKDQNSSSNSNCVSVLIFLEHQGHERLYP